MMERASLAPLGIAVRAEEKEKEEEINVQRYACERKQSLEQLR